MTDVPGRQQLHGYLLRDYDDLIATLREAAKSQGIGMAKLARRLGVTAGTVARCLAGRACSPDVPARLADALGYDLALIPREDTP